MFDVGICLRSICLRHVFAVGWGLTVDIKLNLSPAAQKISDVAEPIALLATSAR